MQISAQASSTPASQATPGSSTTSAATLPTLRVARAPALPSCQLATPPPPPPLPHRMPPSAAHNRVQDGTALELPTPPTFMSADALQRNAQTPAAPHAVPPAAAAKPPALTPHAVTPELLAAGRSKLRRAGTPVATPPSAPAAATTAATSATPQCNSNAAKPRHRPPPPPPPPPPVSSSAAHGPTTSSTAEQRHVARASATAIPASSCRAACSGIAGSAAAPATAPPAAVTHKRITSSDLQGALLRLKSHEAALVATPASAAQAHNSAPAATPPTANAQDGALSEDDFKSVEHDQSSSGSDGSTMIVHGSGDDTPGGEAAAAAAAPIETTCHTNAGASDQIGAEPSLAVTPATVLSSSAAAVRVPSGPSGQFGGTAGWQAQAIARAAQLRAGWASGSDDGNDW